MAVFTPFCRSSRRTKELQLARRPSVAVFGPKTTTEIPSARNLVIIGVKSESPDTSQISVTWRSLAITAASKVSAMSEAFFPGRVFGTGDQTAPHFSN